MANSENQKEQIKKYLRENGPSSVAQISKELSKPDQDNRILQALKRLLDKNIVNHDINWDLVLTDKAKDYNPENKIERKIINLLESTDSSYDQDVLLEDIKGKPKSDLLEKEIRRTVKRMKQEGVLEYTDSGNVLKLKD